MFNQIYGNKSLVYLIKIHYQGAKSKFLPSLRKGKKKRVRKSPYP